MAVEELESTARVTIPRQGRIRRCRVRHVSILPAGDGPRGGLAHPLPLGTMDEARSICNACTATTIWRADED